MTSDLYKVGDDVRTDDPNDKIYVVKREFLLGPFCQLKINDIVRFNGKSAITRHYALLPEYDYETLDLTAIQYAIRRKWIVPQKDKTAKLTVDKLKSNVKSLSSKIYQYLRQAI